MIPTIPYPGGKGRWAEEIVKYLPGGRRYIEPFAGRGNIFWAVASLCPDRYDEWHLNDIRRAPFLEALRRQRNRTPVPLDLRAAYYSLWKEHKKCPTLQSLLLEPIVSRDGGGYGSGGPAGEHHANLRKYQASLWHCSKLMRQLKPDITALDWKELHLEQLKSDCVVLLDPPYFGADVRAYKSEGFDYKGMINLLLYANFKWILMEYEQAFYNRAFGRPFFRKTVGHGSSNKAGQKVECMWKNF